MAARRGDGEAAGMGPGSAGARPATTEGHWERRPTEGRGEMHGGRNHESRHRRDQREKGPDPGAGDPGDLADDDRRRVGADETGGRRNHGEGGGAQDVHHSRDGQQDRHRRVTEESASEHRNGDRGRRECSPYRAGDGEGPAPIETVGDGDGERGGDHERHCRGEQRSGERAGRDRPLDLADDEAR
jgi:hypothetical protein